MFTIYFMCNAKNTAKSVPKEIRALKKILKVRFKDKKGQFVSYD